jgi:hypothetical protein
MKRIKKKVIVTNGLTKNMFFDKTSYKFNFKKFNEFVSDKH